MTTCLSTESLNLVTLLHAVEFVFVKGGKQFVPGFSLSLMFRNSMSLGPTEMCNLNRQRLNEIVFEAKSGEEFWGVLSKLAEKFQTLATTSNFIFRMQPGYLQTGELLS